MLNLVLLDGFADAAEGSPTGLHPASPEPLLRRLLSCAPRRLALATLRHPGADAWEAVAALAAAGVPVLYVDACLRGDGRVAEPEAAAAAPAPLDLLREGHREGMAHLAAGGPPDLLDACRLARAHAALLQPAPRPPPGGPERSEDVVALWAAEAAEGQAGYSLKVTPRRWPQCALCPPQPPRP